MIHRVAVEGGKISVSPRKFTQHRIAADELEIAVTGEWLECDSIVLQIVREGKQTANIVLDGGRIPVPSRFLETTGNFELALIGYVRDSVRYTTARQGITESPVVVETGADVSSTEQTPEQVEPDLWAQLINLCKETAENEVTRQENEQKRIEAENQRVANDEARRKELSEAVEKASSYATAAQSKASEAQSAAKSAQDSAGSADKAAESAAGAAESAGEAAESAVQAAQSAVEAAGSAAGAAQSASGAAQSAQQAAETAQSLIGLVGNQLTGTATGLVAHGEDAYAQKPIELRVKGKTWVNRWPVIEGTSSGVTVATDETGLITFTGTPTASGQIGPFDVLGIGKNKQYTLMLPKAITGLRVLVNNIKNDGSLSGRLFDTTTTTTTSTSDNDPEIVRYTAYFLFDETFAADSLRVVLVDGPEAPDCFTPCASIASVETGKLVTSGKNLLPTAGITDVGGSNNATEYVDLLPGTYTISAQGGPFRQIIVRGDDGTDYSTLNFYTSNATFTLNRSARVRILFWIPDAAGVFVSNPQLELGSTATAYEPPTVTETPLPEVELRSLPNGTCDELVIRADGTCEVERKTGTWTFNGSENWVLTQATGGINVPYFTFVFSGTSESVPLANWGGCNDRLPVENPYTYSGDCFYIFAQGFGYIARIRKSGCDDVASIKEWLASNNVHAVYGAVDTTESQSPVTLPALPAPTFNVYPTGGYVPGDTSVDYVRDTGMVIRNLEEIVNGLIGD